MGMEAASVQMIVAQMMIVIVNGLVMLMEIVSAQMSAVQMMVVKVITFAMMMEHVNLKENVVWIDPVTWQMESVMSSLILLVNGAILRTIHAILDVKLMTIVDKI